MELNLEGRTALVTGGSKGIGLATALEFARAGCNLHLAARTLEDLEAARRRIGEEAPVTVELHALDLALTENVLELARRCRDVDILINNAGALPSGPIEEVNDALWRAGFDLKVFATVNLTREIYLAMKERRSGVIVNVIGNCGERPDPEIILATLANTGLMGFTRALGGVSPRHGVRVVGVNPGPTATERLEKLMRKKAADRTGDPERWTELAAPLPMGRAGTPQELANLIVFAASDAASYVSGTILTADGGVASVGRLF